MRLVVDDGGHVDVRAERAVVEADLRAHGVEHLHVVARRVAVARGRGRQVVAGLGRRAHALVEAARRAVGEERVGLAARALDRGAPGGATAVVVGLVVGGHGRADLARVADVAVGVGVPVVAVAVGVVAGGVLGEVADARDPVAALGGRALERLVLDQLARVVVLLARGHGVAAARVVRGSSGSAPRRRAGSAKARRASATRRRSGERARKVGIWVVHGEV